MEKIKKMETIEDRFLRYVKIDTQSDYNSSSTPSTAKQFDLLNLLKQEALEMGLEDVVLTEKGYLYATIPATTTIQTPTIGFIAHVDTSPDMCGFNVKPQIINYKGGDIVLNSNEGIVTAVSDFPELANYLGHRLITSDGTTLLGADDKAGVAEIMTAAQYLINNKDIAHGKIRIAFTPDEEIGAGADHFDVPLFGCDYGYTIDGSAIGEIEYENFNAASATLSIKGRNVHPGYAKNKMINSLELLTEFDQMLPSLERPQHTENLEGFYHLNHISGSVDSAKSEYIIRDHCAHRFNSRLKLMAEKADILAAKYGKEHVSLKIKEQYRNMREVIEAGNMHVVDRVVNAMKSINITPVIKPIRGGTDGSRLSFMQLPCPNIFAGGENFHGRHEFVSVNVMQKAVELIVEISKSK